MSYTHIQLPKQGFANIHRRVMMTFIAVSALLIVAILTVQLMYVRNTVRLLSARMTSLGMQKTAASAGSDKPSFVAVDPKEAPNWVTEVQEVAVVPDGETPTVVRLTNVSGLQADTFFRNGENDDIVLVYKTAGIVAMYRPFDRKLVALSTMAGASGQVKGMSTKAASTSARMKSITVGVYYANDQLQKQDTFMSDLLAVPRIELTKQELTKKIDYKGIQVIGISRTGKGGILKEVIKAVKGSESSLPAEESITGVDIAIIVGN